MASDILAVDFGTSNSAAAVFENGTVRRIPVEGRASVLPTAVFFPGDGGAMRIGRDAVSALMSGEEGRFMRALKSVLGTSLFHESRLIAGRRRSLAGIVTAFLSELRSRAEAETGRSLRRVLSGRPVRFHSEDDAADLQAEADLRACYIAAGFERVSFLPEPEAAAVACSDLGAAGGIGLIVDVGGGTSDFSVFRSAGAGASGATARPGLEIMASRGTRLGGTDFDHALSMARVMPELGLGGALRREMGPGLLPVPRWPYVELSTWAKIPFLYSRETRRLVGDMVRLAVDPRPLERLAAVLDLELGHDIAFAVERGKIAANAARDGTAIVSAGSIDLSAVVPGLSIPLTAADLDALLVAERLALGEVARSALAEAGVAPSAVRRVVLVGGSSLMRFVRDEMTGLCPDAEVLTAGAFTAVVDGLATASANH